MLPRIICQLSIHKHTIFPPGDHRKLPFQQQQQSEKALAPKRRHQKMGIAACMETNTCSRTKPIRLCRIHNSPNHFCTKIQNQAACTFSAAGFEICPNATSLQQHCTRLFSQYTKSILLLQFLGRLNRCRLSSVCGSFAIHNRYRCIFASRSAVS